MTDVQGSGEFTCPYCHLPIRFVVTITPSRSDPWTATRPVQVADDHAHDCTGRQAAR